MFETCELFFFAVFLFSRVRMQIQHEGGGPELPLQRDGRALDRV
jgi:hypothetical protein